MEREVRLFYSLFISETGSFHEGVIMPQSFALTGPVAEELLSERDFIVLASFSRSFYLAVAPRNLSRDRFLFVGHSGQQYVFRPRELLSAIQITCCIGTSPGYVCRQGGTGRLRYVLPFLSRTETGVAYVWLRK